MVGKILQSRTWELVNFTEFDGLQMSEGMIDARTLGPKDVLVKLVAVSLNYRDLVISRGLYPFREYTYFDYTHKDFSQLTLDKYLA